MARKTRQQRQSEHEDAVKQEAGRLLIFMDRNPDKHVHLAEHRRRCVREGDTVSVEAIDRVWDDAQQHNKKAGPGDVAQGRRLMQRQQSKAAHERKAKADQKNIDRLMEQGRSRAAGIRPDRFGEQRTMSTALGCKHRPVQTSAVGVVGSVRWVRGRTLDHRGGSRTWAANIEPGPRRGEITLDQQRAIIALLEQPTVTAAAREVGLDKSTLYKWLKRDDFKVAYREAKREAMARATSRLQKAAEEAVTALQEIMNDKHVQPAARVGAAKIILDKAQDAQANEDLAARVEALEGDSDMTGDENE